MFIGWYFLTCSHCPDYWVCSHYPDYWNCTHNPDYWKHSHYPDYWKCTHNPDYWKHSHYPDYWKCTHNPDYWKCSHYADYHTCFHNPDYLCAIIIQITICVLNLRKVYSCIALQCQTIYRFLTGWHLSGKAKNISRIIENKKQCDV
jgi:predicted RNA-binding protein